MRRFFDDFLLLFCEKNSDGTKNLRLRGRELQQRIGTRVKACHMPSIVNFLNKHPEITNIDLSYNDLGDEGVTILAKEYFNKENNLISLNLMHCDIGAAGMKELSSSEFLRLKYCRINGNKLGITGARYIANLIENCKNLRSFDFAETDQTLESIECILIVMEQQSTLKSIKMSRVIPNSYYTCYNSSTFADAVSTAMKLNNHLLEIHMSKCGFDGHDVELLLSGLRANKFIQLLDLSCNNIKDFGTELIAVWLKTRPPLLGLNISSNGITDYGARVLSYGMPFSKLRYLNITNNKISDFGLTDILNSLKKPYQMRILFMWGNQIGCTSCKRIKRMLASGVLNQDYIDVKIYEVDGELCAAYYPTNHIKQNYYVVPNYGWPPELKIIKNKIYPPNALPRELINFRHLGRYPPVNEALGLAPEKCKDT